MAFSIAQVDKNFEIALPPFVQGPVAWMDASKPPFALHGLADAANFARVPRDIAATVSPGVERLSVHTTGARIRFVTDSPFVAVRVVLSGVGGMVHMPMSGTSGCDIYLGEKNPRFARCAMSAPGTDFAIGAALLAKKEQVTLCLPLYDSVKEVWVGLKEGSRIEAPAPYTGGRVVYYGSSITQGGCASRPGNLYQGHISRWLDCDYENYGFAGQAKGEASIAKFIASREMDAFVLDYDHNAPSLEHLQNTHYDFYKTIRAAHPDIGIVVVSKPDFDVWPEANAKSRAIIYDTVKRAHAEGDDGVFFVDGQTLFGTQERDACAVDGTHPNDLGFYRMAKTIAPVVEKALAYKKQKEQNK